MTANEKVMKYFSTEWTFTDFFYAYCAAKGIDDPEDVDVMSEEEYLALEKECEEKLTVPFLRELGDKMIFEVNKLIHAAMEREVAKCEE